MSNQPLDKGRVTFVAETYQSAQGEKKRYATLGRATKWAGQNGSPENITIEIDSIPVGHSGTLNLFIFWDSEQQNQPQQQGGQGFNQPQQQYQQQGQQHQQQFNQPQQGFNQQGYGNQRG